MDKQILVGIDAHLSSVTQHALQAVADLFKQAGPHYAITLVTVIPLSQTIAPNPGMYSSQIISLEVTPTQRRDAEVQLYKACLLLQQGGIPSERMRGLIRIGVIADEISKLANELEASLIVVGTHSPSFKQHLRRFFFGSTSQRVLQLASCPVMMVSLPRSTPSRKPKPPNDLVAWYGTAITRYLSEHPGTLQVLTPKEVVHQFVPPSKHTPGRKELAAATLALEQLARNGILCRHDVSGELRYVND